MAQGSPSVFSSRAVFPEALWHTATAVHTRSCFTAALHPVSHLTAALCILFSFTSARHSVFCGLPFTFAGHFSFRNLSYRHGSCWCGHAAGSIIRTAARPVHLIFFHEQNPFLFFNIDYSIFYVIHWKRCAYTAFFPFYPRHLYKKHFSYSKTWTIVL